MSYEPPTPPRELSTKIINTLNSQGPEQLNHIAIYSDKLAKHKEREERLKEENKNEKHVERPDDLPDEVPLKATITIKDIKNNRYYYWQWREGDKVKSKYKGPVNPDK